MLRCATRNLLMPTLLLLGSWFIGATTTPAWGQPEPETAIQYQAVIMEVLSTRLASDVRVNQGRVVLRTPASRTLKAMSSVVQASVPYYLEGAIADFKRFRPRVKEALESLDGWEIPPEPRGWEPDEWQYYQVQGALEDLMLLVALDVGVFANEALASDVRVREQLGTDWTRIRGGTDTMDPLPLPDFGSPVQDGSTLDGLGAGNASDGSAVEDGNAQILAALQDLSRRIAALENQRAGGGGSVPGGGGSWPSGGPDGNWNPGGGTGNAPLGLPDRWPERLTLSFPSGSAALGLSAEYGLNTLVDWMVAEPRLRVLVTGHSDATGSERSNMELSRRRAMIVRYYLLERGIAAERVVASHFGEGRPEWGSGFDRRVEVQLFMDVNRR